MLSVPQLTPSQHISYSIVNCWAKIHHMRPLAPLKDQQRLRPTLGNHTHKPRKLLLSVVHANPALPVITALVKQAIMMHVR